MQHPAPKADNNKLYILATSALLRNPVMLAHSSTRKLVIPTAVKREIGHRFRGPGGQDILAVIESAKKVEFIDAPSSGPQTKDVWDFGDANEAVIRIAAELSAKFTVVVVTQSSILRRRLEDLGIASLKSQDVLNEWSADSLDKGTQKSANAFDSKQLAMVLASGTGGIVVAALAIFAFHFRSYFIAKFTAVGAVLLLCSFSFILFWFRQKQRLPYGAAEWFVGAVMVSQSQYLTTSSGMLVQGIQIIGGLYAMVRGLDNFGKGLQRTKYGELWEKRFKEVL